MHKQSRSRTTRPRRLRLLIMLMLVLGIATLGGWKLLNGASSVGENTQTEPGLETAEAVEGTVSVRVEATAIAEPYLSRTLRAPGGSIVVWVAGEGAVVNAGAPLVRFDDTGLERQESLARIALREAELNLERATDALERAVRTLSDRQELAAAGAISRDQVTAAQEQVTAADFALRSAGLTAERARVTLDTAIQARADAVLRAPFDGTVLSVSASAGDWVGQNATLLTFGDVSRLRFRAEVDEYDIARVEVGLPVTVRSDLLGDRSLAATVEQVSPEAEMVNNISVFRVTVSSGSAGGALKPGMRADLSIQIAEDSGIVVPARAVSTVRTRSYVDVVNGDEVETRRVEIGAHDGVSVVVLSGLEAGELVKLPSRSGVLPPATASPTPTTAPTGTSIIPMSVPGGGGGGGGGGAAR